MNLDRRVRVVAVIGSAGELSPEIGELCQELGAALMVAGFRLVTGGCGGVMRAVSQGARQSPAWKEGRVMGIVPSYRRAEANEFCDVIIPSGMQLARNVLVVATADVVVAVEGGAGTLSEIALAWQLGRPIVALGTRGWAARLAGECLDHRSDRAIEGAITAHDAVRLCSERTAIAHDADDVGAGWRKEREDKT